MPRGFNKGLQQLAKIRDAVPRGSRRAPCAKGQPSTYATRLELHHAGGGTGCDQPSTIIEQANRARLSGSARRSYSTAVATPGEGKQPRGLRQFASAATHASTDGLVQLQLVGAHYALTGECRGRKAEASVPLALDSVQSRKAEAGPNAGANRC